ACDGVVEPIETRVVPIELLPLLPAEFRDGALHVRDALRLAGTRKQPPQPGKQRHSPIPIVRLMRATMAARCFARRCCAFALSRAALCSRFSRADVASRAARSDCSAARIASERRTFSARAAARSAR